MGVLGIAKAFLSALAEACSLIRTRMKEVNTPAMCSNAEAKAVAAAGAKAQADLASNDLTQEERDLSP